MNSLICATFILQLQMASKLAKINVAKIFQNRPFAKDDIVNKFLNGTNLRPIQESS